MDFTGTTVTRRLSDDGLTNGRLVGGTFDFTRVIVIGDLHHVELRMILPRRIFDEIERICGGHRIARSELISRYIETGLKSER